MDKPSPPPTTPVGRAPGGNRTKTNRRRRKQKKKQGATGSTPTSRGEGDHAHAHNKRLFPFESDDAVVKKWARERGQLERYLDSQHDKRPVDIDHMVGHDLAGDAYYEDPEMCEDHRLGRNQLSSADDMALYARNAIARLRDKRELYSRRYGYGKDTMVPQNSRTSISGRSEEQPDRRAFKPREITDVFAIAGKDTRAFHAIEDSMRYVECERFLSCVDPESSPGEDANEERAPCYAMEGEIIAAVRQSTSLEPLPLTDGHVETEASGGGGGGVARRMPGNERIFVFSPIAQSTTASGAFHLVLWIRQTNRRPTRAMHAEEDRALGIITAETTDLTQSGDSYTSPLNLSWHVVRRFYVPPWWYPVL